MEREEGELSEDDAIASCPSERSGLPKVSTTVKPLCQDSINLEPNKAAIIKTRKNDVSNAKYRRPNSNKRRKKNRTRIVGSASNAHGPKIDHARETALAKELRLRRQALANLKRLGGPQQETTAQHEPAQPTSYVSDDDDVIFQEPEAPIVIDLTETQTSIVDTHLPLSPSQIPLPGEDKVPPINISDVAEPNQEGEPRQRPNITEGKGQKPANFSRPTRGKFSLRPKSYIDHDNPSRNGPIEETDYVDLLLEYTEIKTRLERLHEDAKAINDQEKENSTKSASSEKLDSSKQDETPKLNGEPLKSVSDELFRPESPQEGCEDLVVDDEDLRLLELRLTALSSVHKKTSEDLWKKRVPTRSKGGNNTGRRVQGNERRERHAKNKEYTGTSRGANFGRTRSPSFYRHRKNSNERRYKDYRRSNSPDKIRKATEDFIARMQESNPKISQRRQSRYDNYEEVEMDMASDEDSNTQDHTSQVKDSRVPLIMSEQLLPLRYIRSENQIKSLMDINAVPYVPEPYVPGVVIPNAIPGLTYLTYPNPLKAVPEYQPSPANALHSYQNLNNNLQQVSEPQVLSQPYQGKQSTFILPPNQPVTGFNPSHITPDHISAVPSEPIQNKLPDEKEKKEDEAENEEEMRAMLLKDLLLKKQEQRTKTQDSPSFSRSPVEPHNQLQHKKAPTKNKPHHQVVVQLGPDSSDSESESSPEKPSNLTGMLHMFLKEQRETVEKNQQQEPTTKRRKVEENVTGGFKIEIQNANDTDSNTEPMSDPELSKERLNFKVRIENKTANETETDNLGERSLYTETQSPTVKSLESNVNNDSMLVETSDDVNKTFDSKQEASKAVMNKPSLATEAVTPVCLSFAPLKTSTPTNNQAKSGQLSALKETDITPILWKRQPQARPNEAKKKVPAPPPSSGSNIPKTSSKKSDVGSNISSKLAEMEASFLKNRDILFRRQNLISNVASQLARKTQTKLTAKQKLAKLKEQLAATEKIIKATDIEISNLDKKQKLEQAKFRKERLLGAKHEQILLTYGRTIVGPSYNIPKGSESGSPSNNKGSQLQSAKSSSVATTPSSPSKRGAEKKMSAEKISQSMLELRHRQRLVAQKITQLKAVQAARTTPSNTPPAKPLSSQDNQLTTKDIQNNKPSSQPSTKNSKVPSADLKPSGKSDYKTSEALRLKIPTKISFNFPNAEEELVTITPRRRRSLKDMSPSTTPHLKQPLTSQSPSLQSKTTENQGAILQEKKETIKMSSWKQPSEEQLKSFKKLLVSYRQPASSKLQYQTKGFQNIFNFPRIDSNIKISSLLKRSDNIEEEECTTARSYSSSLRMFKSYRLSPFFTQDNQTISSNSYSNLINPLRALCHFELHGKCNDEKCPWQHEEDYTMTPKHILQDIIAYAPTIASSNDKDISKAIAQYVECYQNSSPKLGLSTQINDLLMKVHKEKNSEMPHMMVLEPRKWKPSQVERAMSSDQPPDVSYQKKAAVKSVDNHHPDDVLEDMDPRYWMLDNQNEMHDLESTVLQEEKKNVPLWIKLAYRRLNKQHSSEGETNLTEALHVLARALEENSTSSELWKHYLKLYSQQRDSDGLSELYEQALKYAADYDLFYMYLSFQKTYTEKCAACDRILTWLLDQEEMDATLRSSQLFEILLNQVSLMMCSGRYLTATNLVQRVIGIGKVASPLNISGHLEAKDLALLWLTYLQLLEFRFLPHSLFDPANSNPGYIVSKKTFLLPWQQGEATKKSCDLLQKLFTQAVSQCQKLLKPTDNPEESIVMLVTNWMQMYRANSRFSEAVACCERYINIYPQSTTLWLSLANVKMQSGSDSAIVETREVFRKSILKNATCARLVYEFALFELEQNCLDSAREIISSHALRMFDLDQAKQYDPDVLRSKLLGRELPTLFQSPLLHKNVTQSVLKENMIFLWLCHILAVQLSAKQEAVDGIYEEALAAVAYEQESHYVWKSYLLYLLKKDETASKNSTKFLEVLSSCISSMPCRHPIPLHYGKFWLNYTHHNEILEMLQPHLTKDDFRVIHEHILPKMSGSVTFMQRACEMSIQSFERTAAKGLVLQAILTSPHCLQLQKILIYLNHREALPYQEIVLMYRKAVRQMPMLLTLWKDFIMFELVHGSESSAQKVIEECQHLDLNLQEFLAKLK